jgi:hypothetical protein
VRTAAAPRPGPPLRRFLPRYAIRRPVVPASLGRRRATGARCGVQRPSRAARPRPPTRAPCATTTPPKPTKRARARHRDAHLKAVRAASSAARHQSPTLRFSSSSPAPTTRCSGAVRRASSGASQTCPRVRQPRQRRRDPGHLTRRPRPRSTATTSARGRSRPTPASTATANTTPAPLDFHPSSRGGVIVGAACAPAFGAGWDPTAAAALVVGTTVNRSPSPRNRSLSRARAG